MPKALQISVLFKGKQLKSKTFQGPRVVIGRDPECHLRLENVGVSRHHALIEFAGDEYVLKDLGSSNGTYVDGETITSWVVANGATARITKFDLLFHVIETQPQSEADTAMETPGFGEQNTLCVGDPPARKSRADRR